MQYWLMKSEPDVWSIDQQKKAGAQGAPWDGVRNYQAAKNLKTEKKYYLEHYELLRNTKGIIDIKNALDNETELSYIDEGHYSPNASFAIANKIYLNIAKNIK